MVDSYNCLCLDNQRVFQVEVYEDNDKWKFFEFGNDKKIPFGKFKVGQLADIIARKGELEVSGILNLWKVDADKSKLNIEDDIRKHGGVSMELEHKFERYFKADDELTDNIHIVAVVATTTTGKRRAEYSDLDEENVSRNSKKEKLIDLSTPKSIVEFLLEQEGLKSDFNKPHILCTNRYMFERKGREESFYEAYSYLMTQDRNIVNAVKNNCSLGDKFFYPLIALQSAPGGGKSFFLDEFASFKDEDLSGFLQKNTENKHIIDKLHNSISICITYNGNSPYNSNIDIDNKEIGLVMRIIWSYFFDYKRLSWDSFCKKFERTFESLRISTAIETIIHHSRKSVFLCVDEIMKVKDCKKLLDSLYSPYISLVGKDKVFRFIVSTLDAVYLNTFQTHSGRDINWIPLRRLEFSESIELFSKVTEKLGLDRKYVINKCISDCNGHPRTLEKFYELLSSNNTALEISDFTTLIEGLTKKVGRWFDYITFSVVKLALLGKYVKLGQTVEVNNMHLSIKDLISSGVYINSVTEEANTKKVIPTLTLVSLYYFCMENVDDGDATTVATILRNIFHTENYFDYHSFDGKAYEEFHMNWELLYRALHEDGMEIDLPKIYGLDNKGVKIKIQRKNIVKLQKEEFPPNGKIRDEEGNVINDLEKYIFVPTKSNNSEMIIFERKAGGNGHIAINIECKYSWPDSTTKLSNSDIQDKYDLMRNKYLKLMELESLQESCVKKLKMAIDDIYLVLVGWRDICGLKDSIKNNKNIIIVGKKNLEKIYSPSLVSRPQFYSEILSEIQRKKKTLQ